MSDDPKAVVTGFLTRAFNDKDPGGAVADALGATYRQHNPQVGDGPEAFLQFAEAFVEQFPDLHVDIKRMVVDGELVAVHSHLRVHAEDRGTAVMDVFRVEGGRIVEHWDVMQPVPERAANSNTMF